MRDWARARLDAWLICHAFSLDGMALVWTDMGCCSLTSVRGVRTRNSATAATADPIEIARGAISFCYKGRAVIPGAAGVRQGIVS
jgi:hypothetical protein